MITITEELLRRNGACASGIQAFRKAFPEGIPQDQEEALRIAVEHGEELDFGWAERFLPEAHRFEYTDRARQAVGTYVEVCGASAEKYRLDCLGGRGPAYESRENTAWAANLERKKAARGELRTSLAAAFVAAYFAAQ